MRKFMAAIFMVSTVFFLSLPIASAEVPVPDDIYKWVQSSPRANYYFNMAQMCFEVDKDGMIDQNILLVPTVKTYDPLQVKDVQDKRRWKDLDMTGYDDFAGVAEYLRIDLGKKIITETEITDLDSTGTGLETRTLSRSWELAKLSEKNLDRIFYEAIIDYAAKHKDELVKRTKGTVKPEDKADVKGKKNHKSRSSKDN